MSAGVPPSPQGRSSRRTASEHLQHPRPVLPGLVFSEDGLEIEVGAPGDARVVHYEDLKVTDARGAKLDALMERFAENAAHGIPIMIDDGSAVYRIMVDPFATSPAWTAVGNQKAVFFGPFVATMGDINGDGYSDVIVGAYAYGNGSRSDRRRGARSDYAVRIACAQGGGDMHRDDEILTGRVTDSSF